MGVIIAIVVGVFLGLWLGRRAGPALSAAALILLVPFWLIIGLLEDIYRALFKSNSARK